MTTKKIAF